jgi:N-sulfoglucosamine sulfohydrolase
METCNEERNLTPSSRFRSFHHKPSMTRLLLAQFLLSITVAAPLAAAPAKEPNILFVIADDLTFRDIGCYGGQAITPNIDKLAKEGMRFTRCFQTMPMCSPTRHTIYTGLYPVKSGAYTNHTFTHDHVKSVVHYLQPLGYRVALSGKTHIGPESVFPFEYSMGKPASSVIDFDAVEKILSDTAGGGKPFALFACSNEPHEPWTKGREFSDQYDVAKLKLRPDLVDTPGTRADFRDYLCEISHFDADVGRLLEMLDRQGLRENTLVMVVSEQGNTFPFAKWSLYDSGLQSAMIVRWPGKVKPAAESPAMVEYVDITPTFVAAAGGAAPEGIDGRSFLPVLLGETTKHKPHVFGMQTSRGIYSGPHHYAIRSVRDEQFKLILNLDPDAEFITTMNRKDWFKSWQALAKTGDEKAKATLARYSHRPAVELYDITKDSYEMNNIAGNPENSETIARLRGTLEAWMKEQGDQGMATELAAFTRMLSGNEEFMAWALKNRPELEKKGAGKRRKGNADP